jgi:hypothetical protein
LSNWVRVRCVCVCVRARACPCVYVSVYTREHVRTSARVCLRTSTRTFAVIRTFYFPIDSGDVRAPPILHVPRAVPAAVGHLAVDAMADPGPRRAA